MIQIDILRRKNKEEPAYVQRFLYEPLDPSETVATALRRLNEQEPLLDAEGNAAEPICWENSCLQKKCGACAMVINGRPMLACDANLSALKTPVKLEPLRKFPVVADLMVDRSILFRNLGDLNVWLSGEAEPSERKNPDAYEASRCLQCGCCLEICPNFAVDGSFYGMASMVPSARLLVQMAQEQKKELASGYRKHVFEGCGKSLACQDICPAGINLAGLMARSNAAAVFRRLLWKK